MSILNYAVSFLMSSFYSYSRLPKEDLSPHLELYIQKYGLRNYNGGNVDIDILQANVESIMFYDDSNNQGLISVGRLLCSLQPF